MSCAGNGGGGGRGGGRGGPRFRALLGLGGRQGAGARVAGRWPRWPLASPGEDRQPGSPARRELQHHALRRHLP
eukprot:3341469-Pyramimonas_sp.AAC.1